MHRAITEAPNHRPARAPASGLAPIRDWLDRFAACVRGRDFDAARAMFSDDVASFGTWTPLMDGLDALVERQWRNVWPRTCGFAFDANPVGADLAGDCGWVAINWSSHSQNPDGTPGLRRAGRATIAFRRHDDALLAVHTHFSFEPAGTLLPSTGSQASADR